MNPAAYLSRTAMVQSTLGAHILLNHYLAQKHLEHALYNCTETIAHFPIDVLK